MSGLEQAAEQLEERARKLDEYGDALPEGVTTEAFAEASNLRHEAKKLREQAAEQARGQDGETCDCVPDEFSSRACPKCGRHGVQYEIHSEMVTDGLHVGPGPCELAEAAEARCVSLQEALQRTKRELANAREVTRVDAFHLNRLIAERDALAIAREALAASEKDNPTTSRPPQ